MEIKEIANLSGVSQKTIRYYEDFGLVPPPTRKSNGYRNYTTSDLDRLKLIVGARRLDFSLKEIKEILDLRDKNIAPCKILLSLLVKKSDEIKIRITELQDLEKDLQDLHSLGLTFPIDDIEGKECVCHLVSEYSL